MKGTAASTIILSTLAALTAMLPSTAKAHCDTMDGPVVVEARAALEKKDFTPVLKWIKPAHEPELKSAFARTLSVRPQSKEARELADQFFFETLVRLHREGEGAPYTGLKPAGTKLDPAIEAADHALDNGKAEPLLKALADETANGISTRFAEAREKKQHAGDSVEAGRDYVAAYVDFVHYVEALHSVASRTSHAHGKVEKTTEPANPAQEHKH